MTEKKNQICWFKNQVMSLCSNQIQLQKWVCYHSPRDMNMHFQHNSERNLSWLRQINQVQFSGKSHLTLSEANFSGKTHGFTASHYAESLKLHPIHVGSNNTCLVWSLAFLKRNTKISHQELDQSLFVNSGNHKEQGFSFASLFMGNPRPSTDPFSPSTKNCVQIL